MDEQKTQKKRILLVEDETLLLEALKDKFTSEGFDVLVATNGEEGLATALKEHPDLIVLDIIMPKMDGLTMLENLRKDEWGKDVEVFMLSNVNESTSISGAINQKVKHFLVKSDWDLAEIVNEVKETLGQ